MSFRYQDVFSRLRSKRSSLAAYSVATLQTSEGIRGLVFRGTTLTLVTQPFVTPAAMYQDLRARMRLLRLCRAPNRLSGEMRAEAVR